MDDNGQTPEIHRSNGKGDPCRHCLEMIEQDEEFLVLSYRPFDSIQPYAEQGPIFLHRHECPVALTSNGLPNVLLDSPRFLLRGYDSADRIVYGTGKTVPTSEVNEYAAELLNNDKTAFVHVRSAVNNCFQAKIVRK